MGERFYGRTFLRENGFYGRTGFGLMLWSAWGGLLPVPHISVLTICSRFAHGFGRGSLGVFRNNFCK